MTSIPPGWYPDQNGVTRWWDGTQWTAATQPPTPAQPTAPGGYAQQGYAQQGYQQGYAQQGAYAPVSQYPQVEPGTPGTTVWAWLVALLPIIDVVLSLGYTLSIPAAMSSFVAQMGSVDPSTPEGASRLSAAMLGTFFNGWYAALLIVGLLVYAATVVFSYFDHRELVRRGYVKPFHWAWAFLGSLVYIIGRTVVVHRRGGRSLGPLWAMIAVFVASIVIGWIGGAVISVQTAEIMNRFVQQYGGSYGG
ncbi:DUF2510 domain-containing protein [Microbacterium mangrovi]|uniref:DUF2510 domain-containing protein n=1 Tax=Microbacterium mangrovi TaxID=1348253 RepID=UPI000691673D|nr:DUF2510 domain-containing protein [Microbacterium mangrovi]